MDVVEGLGQGLQGQRGLSKPAAWDGFVSRVVSSSNGALVEKVRALDATLGSAAALDDARRVARDASASAEARRSALQSLIDARASDLRQIAEPLLNDQAVNAVAATALSAFDDAAIAARLVEAYPRFVPADRPKLMAALTSRASFAGALLDAVAAGRLPRSAISAIDAQQMRSLNDAATTRKLGEVWGEIRDSPEAKKQLAARYKTELTPASLAAADLSQGRAIFAGTCGACHTLYGEGGKVGPDLTGAARRHDLDALLAKITDPSSELPADSRITILTLKDGRTVTGIVANRTATTISLRLTADPVTVALSDIASTAVSSASIMPEGLLEAMTPVQRRNLVAYLMGNEQVK
jgi:putative heme-binding domain-containing protein